MQRNAASDNKAENAPSDGLLRVLGHAVPIQEPRGEPEGGLRQTPRRLSQLLNGPRGVAKAAAVRADEQPLGELQLRVREALLGGGLCKHAHAHKGFWLN